MILSADTHYSNPQPIIVPQRAELGELGAIYSKFDNPELMREIEKAESNENPLAYNPEWHYKDGEKYCQGSFGIFQIGCINYPGDPRDLFDPEINAEVAKKVLSRQNYKAWGVCKDKVDCST